MGFYKQQIIPRLMNLAMDSEPFHKVRKRALKNLDGTVLEIGFGTGLNLPFYPQAVKKIIAIDSVEFDSKYINAHKIANGPSVHFIHCPGESLPLRANSVDHVVTTWTLCSVQDPLKILAEINRVLKSGGTYVFVEHGKSPEPFIAVIQNCLTPIHKRCGGGCHLNCSMNKIIAQSALRIKKCNHFYMKGLKFRSYLYVGLARKQKLS